MLLVYDLTNGAVLDNTGTSSAWPSGPPEEHAYVNTDAAGRDREGLGLLRLHDQRDEAEVQMVLTRSVTVIDGQLVDGGPLPAPAEPEPVPDPNAELVAAITAATTLAQLKDALIGKGRPAAVAGRGKNA